MISFLLDFIPKIGTGTCNWKASKRGARMKKLFYITIFFIAISAHPLVSHGSSGPRIWIEAKEFDLKEVEEGKVVTHAFKVLNKGDQTLEIKRVNPG